MSFVPDAAELRRVFDLLFSRYGPQHWWPGESPFEIMVGAVLTQNSAWTNVERAINNLKLADSLSLEAMLKLSHEQLADLIYPAGYFNVKALRLKNLCAFLQACGGESALSSMPTEALRKDLLGINGVGPETADDILLYAFHRPVFVIDAYTRRLFSRLGIATGSEKYEALRFGFEQALGADVGLYNEYHAVIVKHAKLICSSRPLCEKCQLEKYCVKNLG